METNEIPTLTRLCLNQIVDLIMAEANYHKAIKDFCRVIPNHLLVTIFDILQERGITITDVTLLLSLVPTRTKLILPASLHIRNSTLKQIGYNCPSLRYLDLSDCVQVSNTVVRIVLQGCPELSDLRLDRCHRVTDTAFDMTESPFEALVGCLSLKLISLQGCPQITGEIVSALNKLCGKLKYLNLSQCKRISSAAIKQVFEHHQLVALNLSFLDSGCVSDEAFSDFPATESSGSSSTHHQPKSSLKTLNLGKSIISDLSMFKMSYLSELTEIRLQWCQGITDTGIRALTTHCPRLRLIDLKSCLITDDAVMSIARDSKELEMLDLSWCSKLTDHCLEYLAAASQGDVNGTGKNGIEALYLVWCSNITEEGVELLADIPSLKLVDLSGCLSIGSECVENLKSQGKQVIQ